MVGEVQFFFTTRIGVWSFNGQEVEDNDDRLGERAILLGMASVVSFTVQKSGVLVRCSGPADSRHLVIQLQHIAGVIGILKDRAEQYIIVRYISLNDKHLYAPGIAFPVPVRSMRELWRYIDRYGKCRKYESRIMWQ